MASKRFMHRDDKEIERSNSPETQEFERHLVKGLPGQPDYVYRAPGFQTKSNIRKILQRLDEEEQETKRPRTPEHKPEEEKEMMEAATTLTDIQHSPAWCDPIRPLDILGGQYPDPQSMQLSITKSKRVGAPESTRIYFVGIRHGYGGRPWSLQMQSPACYVKFDPTKFETEDHSRVLIQPSIPVVVEYRTSAPILRTPSPYGYVWWYVYMGVHMLRIGPFRGVHMLQQVHMGIHMDKTWEKMKYKRLI